MDVGQMRDIGVGVGVLLAGIGIFIGMIALARTMGRLRTTLDVVDRQIDELGAPVAATLGHVGGIADTADQTLSRVTSVVKSLEDVAGSVSETATLAKDALAPAIVNVGATITGISAGLRRLISGNKSAGES